MDTSETYIKMCDCWDIQIHRIPTIESIGDEEECQWQDGDFFVQNILIDRPPGIYIYKDLCPYCEPSPGIKMIWLPRQDQIQEMIGGGSGSLDEFHRFARSEMEDTFTFPSYEQLWLAFYMHEKHKKFWDGTKWKKK